MSKIIRLIDRTRTVTDWKCPRARYWGYEYGGRGVSPQSGSLALTTGIVIHDALAAIATYQQKDGLVPIDTIANLAFNEMVKILTPEDIVMAEAVEFAKEQASLTEGLLRGFHKHVWPRLMDQYPKIVAIEAEMEYPLGYEPCLTCGDTGFIEIPPSSPGPGEGECCPDCINRKPSFIFMAKPDLIVEDRNGELVYLEYKSTSSKKEQWVNSWDTAVQLHSSVKATEATLGRAPAYVQIVGLYKGYESYGKQSSPFCYAYLKKGNPPFTTDAISYAYKAGFKRYPTWELEGGVKKWVDDMPDQVLADQFPMTPQIMVNEDLVERFFKQRLNRERDIQNGLALMKASPAIADNIMDVTFPQRFDQCVPSFGYACDFRRLCHSRTEDPLKEGFTLREPHHSRELEAIANV